MKITYHRSQTHNSLRVKIVSDGTTQGTRIVEESTGEPLGFVQSIEWKVDVNDTLATATVKFVKIPVEIVCEVDLEEEEDD